MTTIGVRVGKIRRKKKDFMISSITIMVSSSLQAMCYGPRAFWIIILVMLP